MDLGDKVWVWFDEKEMMEGEFLWNYHLVWKLGESSNMGPWLLTCGDG